MNYITSPDDAVTRQNIKLTFDKRLLIPIFIVCCLLKTSLWTGECIPPPGSPGTRNWDTQIPRNQDKEILNPHPQAFWCIVSRNVWCSITNHQELKQTNLADRRYYTSPWVEIPTVTFAVGHRYPAGVNSSYSNDNEGNGCQGTSVSFCGSNLGDWTCSTLTLPLRKATHHQWRFHHQRRQPTWYEKGQEPRGRA